MTAISEPGVYKDHIIPLASGLVILILYSFGSDVDQASIFGEGDPEGYH